MSGPLFDLGYFRSMLIVGNFLVVFGIMMLSLSKTYWQVFLSQGVCMGLGAGLLYIPSLALVGVWFSKKRALAMGIVMSGIAVGKLDSHCTLTVSKKLSLRRRSHIHHHVRPPGKKHRLPLGHPRNRLRRSRRCTALHPRAPLRLRLAQNTPQAARPLR